MEPRASARARFEDSDSDGRRSARRGGPSAASGRAQALPLLDLAFGAAAGQALPPLGAASEPSERRSARLWDAQPRTARVDSSSEQQALMRSAVSWHAGNGSSSSGGAEYDYDDPSLVVVQEDDSSAMMEAADPELFHAGVVEHARRLGMDPETDQELLWIARESLVAPVPSGWYHVPASETTASYYYYEVTGESRWDHPCDDLYRQMYRQAKMNQQGNRHYDQQYRSGNGYYAPSPAMNYQTSAWGEEAPRATTSQSGYDAAYGDQSWSNGGYYDAYSTDSSANTISYAQSSAGGYTSDQEPNRSRVQQEELPRIEQHNSHSSRAAKPLPVEVVESESPRGVPAVQPYNSEKNSFSDDNSKQNDSAGNDEAVEKLKQEVCDLVEQLSKCNQSLEIAELDMSKLRKKNDKLVKQIETATKENEEAVISKQLLMSQLDAMKVQLERCSKANHEESAFQKELEDEKIARQELTKQLLSVKEESADVQQQLRSSQSIVKQLEQDLEALKQASKRADEQAATTSAATVSILEAELARKDTEVKEAQAQIQALKQEIAQIKVAHVQAVEAAKESEDKLSALKNKLEASHKEGSALEASILAAQSEIAILKKRMEDEAASHAAQLGEAEDQQRSLKRELRSNERELKTLQSASKDKDTEIVQLKVRCESAETRLQEQLQAVEAARQQGYRDAEKANADSMRLLQEEKARMAELYTQEMLTRRKLHNRLMELQGNIRVFCRVRPIQPVEEKSDQCAPAVFFRENDRESLDLVVGGADTNGDKANGVGQKYAFEFDHVFQPSSTQDDVFEQTRALVVSALDGFNVCVFAYGQTGSGKTHTMEGPPNDRGVNYRALRELFAIRDARMASGNFECTMKLSILEVYNETVVDLLDSSGSNNTIGSAGPKGLDIRIGKTGVYVDNLIEVEVHNENDVLDLMKLGHSHRSVGSHDFNEHSSRSHLVLSITIEAGTTNGGSSKTDASQTQQPQRRRASKLHLIDLAGSERVSKTAASGQRLKEAQNINRSLSALGDVIAALGSNSKHVPYRNSKLTFLLQDSLSGSSKVLMFVNVSPVQWNAWETLCSLNFAARCRNVALGQAKPNNAAPPPPGAPGGNGGSNSMHATASMGAMSMAPVNSPARAITNARPPPSSVPKSTQQQRIG